MKKDAPITILGVIVLLLGIAILLFVLSQALAIVAAPGEYFDKNFPEDEDTNTTSEPTYESTSAPSAQFDWNSNILNVQFNDQSWANDGNIESWDWDFNMDGVTDDTRQSPDYNFAMDGTYTVTLQVEDEYGGWATATADVNVDSTNMNSGSSMQTGSQDGQREVEGDGSFDLGLGAIGQTMLIGMLYFVMFAVGSVITKAGYTILKPAPEQITVKVKRKDIEAVEAEQTSRQVPRRNMQRSAYNKPAGQDSQFQQVQPAQADTPPPPSDSTGDKPKKF